METHFALWAERGSVDETRANGRVAKDPTGADALSPMLDPDCNPNTA